MGLFGNDRSATTNIKNKRIFAYHVVNAERRPSIFGLERLKRYSGESQKNKIGDAVLLPSSKDSVVNLHGTQYLLRFVVKSLPKRKTQGKHWMPGTEVWCRFLLMAKQKNPVSCQGASGLIPTCRGPQTQQRRRPMTKHWILRLG